MYGGKISKIINLSMTHHVCNCNVYARIEMFFKRMGTEEGRKNAGER